MVVSFPSISIRRDDDPLRGGIGTSLSTPPASWVLRLLSLGVAPHGLRQLLPPLPLPSAVTGGDSAARSGGIAAIVGEDITLGNGGIAAEG